MSTDTTFDFGNSNQENIEYKVEDNEIVLPFEIREQFRPVLMEFFEQTNKHSGSYIQAEEMALQHFEKLGIPRTAWDFRTRRH